MIQRICCELPQNIILEKSSKNYVITNNKTVDKFFSLESMEFLAKCNMDFTYLLSNNKLVG